MNEYTILIRYLDKINACEVISGDELVVVSASSPGSAVASLEEFADVEEGSYCVVAVVDGCYETISDFWDAVDRDERMFAEEAAIEHEEDLWEKHMQDVCEETGN